jgi:hypothetical protein
MKAAVQDGPACPMLVADSEGDKSTPGQAQKLYDALHCPKEFMLFA